jgi:hypothetical protein
MSRHVLKRNAILRRVPFCHRGGPLRSEVREPISTPKPSFRFRPKAAVCRPRLFVWVHTLACGATHLKRKAALAAFGGAGGDLSSSYSEGEFQLNARRLSALRYPVLHLIAYEGDTTLT